MATESKQHTPGKWEFSGIRPSELKDGVLTIALDQPFDRYVVRHCHRDNEGRKVTQFVADILITKGHEAETEANACLIAASPDLKAFVEKYVRETNCICKMNKLMAAMDVHVPCTHCEAKALIRKATEPEETR